MIHIQSKVTRIALKLLLALAMLAILALFSTTEVDFVYTNF
jgi:hypothetical protein